MTFVGVYTLGHMATREVQMDGNGWEERHSYYSLLYTRGLLVHELE